MPAAWFADRLRLYAILQGPTAHSTRQLAAQLGRSSAWVKRWTRRIGTPPHPDPLACCRSRPSTRHTPPPEYDPLVIARILELRETLTARFHRTVGSKTILYYLHQDADLVGLRLPRSATTIWKILDQHGLILRPASVDHQPRTLAAPMTEIEIDFTDIPTIARAPDADSADKQQHIVEAFNWVDAGTSIPLVSLAHEAFAMDTVLTACAQILRTLGVPPLIRCDRDPRLVGDTRDDFPSAFMQLWAALGVTIDLCPPQKPQAKPYVERYHLALKTECLRPLHPTTVAEAQAVMDTWRATYIQERPHQGQACQNQPPGVVFPDPLAWPALPETVNPDAWLTLVQEHVYQRRVNASGSIMLGTTTYFIGRQWAGQEVVVWIDGPRGDLVVMLDERELRRKPLKGLVGAPMTFDAYLTHLTGLARTAMDRDQARQRQRQRRLRGR